MLVTLDDPYFSFREWPKFPVEYIDTIHEPTQELAVTSKS